MNDAQRGDARAQGFFANMVRGIELELAARERSPEYINQFWRSFEAECWNFLAKDQN